MPGSDPNEEGLRAIGRAIDSSKKGRGRSRASGRGPGRANPGAGRSTGDWAADPRPATRRGAHAGGAGAGRRRPPRRRWLRRTLLITLVVVVAVVGSAVGYFVYINGKVHRITVTGLSSGATTGADANTENILMVGSTTRCGLKKQTAAYGLCTQGVTGVNSDVIMILHLDPANKKVSILSIPRDLFIPNARKTGTGYGAYKVDAALAQGPTQLVAAIEEDFGIPIQHYVELNFDTFAGVVTALGGITMEFPVPIFDRYSGLHVFQTGCHHLTGVQALQVVRARHLQYWVTGDTPSDPAYWPQEAQSDLARIVRDHEFLRVLAAKVAKRGLGNPAADLSLVNAIAPQLTVDSGLSATTMVTLVLTFHGVNVNSAPQMTLPVLVGTFGTYTYKGFPKGTVEFPTHALDQSVIDKFLGVTADTNTMTGQRLPAPSAVSVSVVDGSGTYGQATSTAAALGHLGFHVVGTGSATPVGREAETLVTYAHRTATDIAAAQLVANSLSGSVVLAYGPTTDGAQVTVTTGTNYSVNASAPSPANAAGTTTPSGTPSGASTGTSTAQGGTTTSTTAGASSPGAFTAPSPAVEPLTPYDPRGCPSGVSGNNGNW